MIPSERGRCLIGIPFSKEGNPRSIHEFGLYALDGTLSKQGHGVHLTPPELAGYSEETNPACISPEGRT